MGNLESQGLNNTDIRWSLKDKNTRERREHLLVFFQVAPESTSIIVNTLTVALSLKFKLHRQRLLLLQPE